MTRIALVIPVFNEAGGLPQLVAQLRQVVADQGKRFDVSFRLVLVDDGSQDGSADVIRGLASPALPIQLIRLSRNFGKEAALSAGLDAARNDDAVVVMDADLQHPPQLIASFLKEWRENGAEVVYTYKTDRLNEGVLKRGFSRIFYRLINMNNRYKIPENAGDFRFMTQQVVSALLALPENERFMKGLYAWVGFRQTGIAYTPADRAEGKTRFSGWALLMLSIDGLTSFSISPLRAMSVLGFSISALSVVYFIYIFFERLFLGDALPGFASIVTLITFFGGVQLVCLGIIGEYLGKILMEAKRRPTYIVAESCELGAPDPEGPAAL